MESVKTRVCQYSHLTLSGKYVSTYYTSLYIIHILCIQIYSKHEIANFIGQSSQILAILCYSNLFFKV